MFWHILYYRRFFARHGLYLEIYSDNGSNVDSVLMNELAKMLGCIKTHTVPYNARANGAVENRNYSIANVLAKFTKENPRDWDKKLPLAMLSLRSAMHRSTKFSPARMTFGRELYLPMDLVHGPSPDQKRSSPEEYVNQIQSDLFDVHQFARDKLAGATENHSKKWNSRCTPNPLKVASTVMIKRKSFGTKVNKKFLDKWLGPYIVTRIINDVLVRVQIKEFSPNNFKVYNLD